MLITGANGFIGSNFLKHVKGRGNILAPSHKQLDILDKKALKEIFNTYAPQVVINFAAHRDANSAELQRGDRKGSAWETNVDGMKNLFSISQENNSFFIHISTDMVFAGAKERPGPYDESAEVETDIHKLSWYGWTKAEGERIINGKKHAAIVRIGNVTEAMYDPKLDYVGKILYLFDHKRLYPLFYDQYITLTYIPKIFETIDAIVKSRKNGIFHVASANRVSPHALATYLIKKTRKKTILAKISIEEYLKESPNRYPIAGGLSAEQTEKILGIRPITWQEIADLYT